MNYWCYWRKGYLILEKDIIWLIGKVFSSSWNRCFQTYLFSLAKTIYLNWYTWTSGKVNILFYFSTCIFKGRILLKLRHLEYEKLEIKNKKLNTLRQKNVKIGQLHLHSFFWNDLNIDFLIYKTMEYWIYDLHISFHIFDFTERCHLYSYTSGQFIAKKEFYVFVDTSPLLIVASNL